MLLFSGWCLAGVAAAAPPIVAAGPGAVYVAQPDTQSLLAIARSGAIMRSRHLGDTPSALALDPQRGLLYVALRHVRHILVLQARTLRPVRTVVAVAGASNLVAVAGRNAVYLFDPKTQREMYLTFTRHGSARLSPVFAAIKPPNIARLHVSIPRSRARGTAAITYWASGFRPHELVSVSWGASNQGTVEADRYGIVSGLLAIAATARPGLHSVGLYGRSSNLALSRVVETGPRRSGGTRARRAPPLYLGVLPGPVATMAPPLLHSRFRVPISAGGFGALPVLAAIAWMRARRRRRRRRTVARPRKPARRK